MASNMMAIAMEDLNDSTASLFSRRDMVDDVNSTPTRQPRDAHHQSDIEPIPSSQRGLTFWMVFVSTLLVDMLSAIDLTAVATTLPTIVEKLHGDDFIWAGGAYTIASTAILPLVGGLVEGFGRKSILLTFICFFCVGRSTPVGQSNIIRRYLPYGVQPPWIRLRSVASFERAAVERSSTLIVGLDGGAVARFAQLSAEPPSSEARLLSPSPRTPTREPAHAAPSIIRYGSETAW
ncbi:hypothetical protein GSI_11912 [Ganoderma sinense ZZ0214-1]|uniref:MFS general substrate transporter n=1 Tax=Ganoderma sinense ZZ0214-1 TaxID=1077348 RepID=A0A2G8RXE5_9APHY|nr:hypothetical protein GSI_11912 [Ganoderma sinense ZZ0214-1]